MAEILSPIWTSSDRLCTHCGAQAAQSDDWLCECCRADLERTWSATPVARERPPSAVARAAVPPPYPESHP